MDKRVNNKGSIGNKGGRPYSKDNREKAATLKGLSLDWMLRIMQSKEDCDKPLQKAVVMKIATTCIPIVVEGEDESPLVVKLINYARSNNSISVSATELPIGLPISSTEVQGGSVEQKEWEVKDSTKPTDLENAG